MSNVILTSLGESSNLITNEDNFNYVGELN